MQIVPTYRQDNIIHAGEEDSLQFTPYWQIEENHLSQEDIFLPLEIKDGCKKEDFTNKYIVYLHDNSAVEITADSADEAIAQQTQPVMKIKYLGNIHPAIIL